MTKINTLRARLVLWTMAINGLLLFVLGGTGWIVLLRAQDQALSQTLELSAAQLIAAVDVTNGSVSVPASDAAALIERGVSGWMIDRADHAAAVVGDVAGVNLSAARLNQSSEQQLASGETIRLLRRPLAETPGSVVVGVSTQPLQRTSRNTLLALGFATPVVLALSALGGMFLAGRALQPIAAITAQARRIGRDNLSDRLALAGPRDEVRELAQTFDEMLNRLQAAFESEQRFTSDASHELRTPLALLKAQVTLALARPRDAAELTQMLRALDSDVDRMTRLVETMLTLARSGESAIQRVPVDLAQILHSLLAQLQAGALQQQVSLAFRADPQSPAMALGDADRLTQLFLNLLDNAVRHCVAGGSVRVGLHLNYMHWQVDITDTGAGISPDHLPHIFERFYRADSSRARQTGGAGLGLAIARLVVEQHGGQISAQSLQGTGSVFTVSLPALAAHSD